MPPTATPERPRAAAQDHPSKPTPLERDVEDYLASRVIASKTLHYYHAVLTKDFLPFCARHGVTSPSQVTKAVVDRWSVDLARRKAKAGFNHETPTRTLSPETVHSYQRAVQSYMRWAEWNKDRIEPELVRRPDREMDVLTTEEYEAMRQQAGERDRLIIQLLWQTGMRAAELTSLRVDDLEEGEGRSTWVSIKDRTSTSAPRSPRVKGGHERKVRILPSLYKALIRYAKDRPDPDRPYLWQGQRRNLDGNYANLTPSGLGQMLASVAERARVKKSVNPHIWRHSFATRMILAEGMDLMSVQKILGHRSLTMLQRHYSHVSVSQAGQKLMSVLEAEQEARPGRR